MTTVTYQIDSEDRLQKVSDSWSSFALTNGATQLTGDAVIGTPIWDWIAGAEVRHIYHLVFQRVRAKQENVTFPFRCDSPEMRRFMELSVSPLSGSGLAIEARFIRTEARPFVGPIDPSAPRSDELVVLCSWCKCALAPGNRWLELEEAIPALDLVDQRSPSITHTICPDCESRLDYAD